METFCVYMRACVCQLPLCIPIICITQIVLFLKYAIEIELPINNCKYLSISIPAENCTLYIC